MGDFDIQVTIDPAELQKTGNDYLAALQVSIGTTTHFQSAIINRPTYNPAGLYVTAYSNDPNIVGIPDYNVNNSPRAMRITRVGNTMTIYAY